MHRVGFGSKLSSALSVLLLVVSRARSEAGVNILFKKDSGVVTAIELERGLARTVILGIVVGKFRHWQ